MSFNLSTLADIGGGGVVSSSDIDATPIAPELIGEGVHTADSVNGHAPHRTSPSVDSQQPSSAYPNFANSNARGGDEDVSAAWDTTQSYGVSDRQWDETAYTYDPTSTVNTVEAGIQPDPTGASPPKEDNPKPKKRPRVSKPRVPKAEREDQLELEQMEFENPDQDVKTGPVFIHPPPGTAQACVRCHRIKRKCDQARPRCAGCSKSDVPCVFELSPATSLFVSNLKSDNASLSTQIASATERIAQLESVVSALERGGGAQSQFGIEPDTRYYDNRTFTEADTDFSALARTILGVRSSSDTSTSLPAYEIAQSAVETFFTNFDLVYPFLDKHELVKDMELAYVRLSEAFVPSTDELRGKEFVLYMVFALGTIGKEANGEVEKGTFQKFKEKAMTHLSSILATETLLSVQSLILLALYNLAIPSTGNPTQILALAIRTAISLGVHRQDDSIVSLEEAENRKRAFWSLYNLDRYVAWSMGQPLSFSDTEMSVEMPKTLIFDSTIDGSSKAKILTHIIKYYQMISQIRSSLQSSASAHTTTIETRPGLVSSILAQLDSWLATSPSTKITGVRPADPSWFKVQYFCAKVFLYRPSASASAPSSDTLQNVYTAAVGAIDLWSANPSLVGGVDAIGQAQIAITLLWVLSVYHHAQPALQSKAGWKQEIHHRLNQVQNLVGTSDIPTKLRHAYEQLENGLVQAYGPIGGSSEGMNALADAIGVGGGSGARAFVLPKLNGKVVTENDEAWKIVKKVW